MKKLLMLGGGFLQTYVIKKAKKCGYYVLVVDGNPNAMGYAYADEYAVINIVDEEACLEYAREKCVDGVLTAATDYGVLSMSRIATDMHLPGINYTSATLIKNKAAVRKCLFDARADDTGYSFEIDYKTDIADLSDKVKFPVMVKPCDGSGSRGASRVDKVEDFEEACKYAMAGSITHRAVAEPFVVGQEYGVESFVDHGVVHVLGVMKKEMTAPPYYAELGHAMPSGLGNEMENKVKLCVRNALLALGVNHGSVNMDLLITDEGGVHIIDVGARMGGNLIGSHIIPQGAGVDYMENMIRAAVGDKTNWTVKWKPSPVATKLLALRPGIVAALPDFSQLAAEYNVEIEHHLHVGDQINDYHTNLDGCGYIVAGGKTVEDAIAKASEVKSIVNETIVRE